MWQGGASLKDGEFELMVHRRIQVDDSRGVEVRVPAIRVTRYAHACMSDRAAGDLCGRDARWLP